MGLATLIFAFLIGKVSPIITLLILGVSYIFNSLGPGTVVGFWGVELFPARIRGITQSITVLAGRLGVITTTLLFPILLQSFDISGTMIVLGMIGIMAALVTMLLPEPSQKSLSQFEFSYEQLKAPLEDKARKM